MNSSGKEWIISVLENIMFLCSTRIIRLITQFSFDSSTRTMVPSPTRGQCINFESICSCNILVRIFVDPEAEHLEIWDVYANNRSSYRNITRFILHFGNWYARDVSSTRSVSKLSIHWWNGFRPRQTALEMTVSSAWNTNYCHPDYWSQTHMETAVRLFDCVRAKMYIR